MKKETYYCDKCKQAIDPSGFRDRRYTLELHEGDRIGTEAKWDLCRKCKGSIVKLIERMDTETP